MDRDFNPADGGYIQVMNEFMDFLARSDLTKNEHKIICLSMRWIWGVKGRAWAPLPWKFIVKKTRMRESSIGRTLQELKKRNILLTKIEENVKYYKINSKTSTWQKRDNDSLPKTQATTPKSASDTPKSASDTPKSASDTPKSASDTPKSASEIHSQKRKYPLPKTQVSTPKNVSTSFKNNIIKTDLKTPLYTPHQSGADADAKNIIDFINFLSGKKFKYSKTSLEPINARLKEGYTLKQCLAVCQNKWLDPDLKEKYFRPVTLFEDLFESYVNEIGTKHKRTKKQSKRDMKDEKWRQYLKDIKHP